MTLTEFLMARLDEDAAAARLGEGAAKYGSGPSLVAQQLLWSAARVLADVEAKRRIVSLCAPTLGDALSAAIGQWDEAAWKGQQILGALALPYADHPDYQQEWRT